MTLNPRTYMQIHIPIVVKEGGGGVDGTPQSFHVMLQYFEAILLSM